MQSIMYPKSCKKCMKFQLIIVYIHETFAPSDQYILINNINVDKYKISIINAIYLEQY